MTDLRIFDPSKVRGLFEQLEGELNQAVDERTELAADNEWLREGLRGIARMDPKTEGDRMVLWANDTLSGRACQSTALEAALAKEPERSIVNAATLRVGSEHG